MIIKADGWGWKDKLGVCDCYIHTIKGFSHSSVGKQSAYNAGDPGSIPGSGRSLGRGNGNPPQYSYLENPMDRGAWRLQSMGL